MDKKLLILFTFCLIFSLANAQIALNQVDDFEDGTTQSWRIGGAGSSFGPVNIADGGPAGAGDNFIQYTSTGVENDPASKMVFFSQNAQWSGDYIAAGVDEITLAVRCLDNDLNLRIALQQGGNRMCTTNAINITAGGSWTTVTIPIAPSDFTVVAGGATAADILSSVFTLRILSSDTPTWDEPDIVAASIQVDNVMASSSLSAAEFSFQEGFSISPNPSKSNLNIKLPQTLDNANVSVFDVLGKKVYTGAISNLSTSINVSNWNSGVYLVRLSTEAATYTKRFVKQ